MSNERIRTPVTANRSLSPKLRWMNNSIIRLNFKGSCLKQEKLTFTPRNVVNLFTVYELDRWSQDINADFTLKDCSFEDFKCSKNVDPDKYSYSRYDIGFGSFSCYFWSTQQFISLHW